MYRSAEITSLISPLQELQDRISLEVPAAFIQEESIREADDQKTASYALVYHTREDNDPAGYELDVTAVLDRLAEDVLSSHEVAWNVDYDGRGYGELEASVVVAWPDAKEREASIVRRANDALDVVPLTVYADQDVYNVATDGNTFQILLNGNAVVGDAPSAAFALGAFCLLYTSPSPRDRS